MDTGQALDGPEDDIVNIDKGDLSHPFFSDGYYHGSAPEPDAPVFDGAPTAEYADAILQSTRGAVDWHPVPGDAAPAPARRRRSA